MGTKNNPGRFDCYAAAAGDEPMFVLLARDARAPMLVEIWAMFERCKDGSDPEFAAEAERVAAAMRAYRRDVLGRDPRADEPVLTVSGAYYVKKGGVAVDAMAAHRRAEAKKAASAVLWCMTCGTAHAISGQCRQVDPVAESAPVCPRHGTTIFGNTCAACLNEAEAN